MTRRVLAFVLALTLASGAQGTLMHAAAAAAAEKASNSVVEALSVAEPAVALTGADPLGNALSDDAVQCQRGANPCFGYGSWNCCTEALALGILGAALGAWLAVAVNVYHYWYYC